MLRACGNAQQSLRGGFYAHQAAIFGKKHIATADHLTALQKNRQHAPFGVLCLEATFLTHVPIQRHCGRALDQSRSQSLAAWD